MKDEPMPPQPQRQATHREPTIAAYLSGDLPRESREALEREAAADPGLRQEIDDARHALDAAREWLARDPPDVQRADRIPIPRLARPAQVVELRVHAWRAAAAAALLMAGFMLGRASGATHPTSTTGNLAPEIASQGVPPVPVGNPSKPDAAATPVPAMTPQPLAAPIRQAFLPSRRVTDHNGRVIIETTLPVSGAHATWIVDGNFRLASATEQ